MRKCISIIYYEYIMQQKRIVAWGVLVATCVISLIDNLPTERNLVRLEFLSEPAYFMYRTMSIDALVMTFGLMFLLSNRIPHDRKTGVKSMVMASPITKGQYICGKLLGGFLYTCTMLALFLTMNILAYIMASPIDVSLMDCFVPLIKTLIVSVLPVSVFISFTSVALPAVMDKRLFYLMGSVLFFVNAFSVGSAGPMPFYLITSGDLIKLIWNNPGWPFTNTGSIQANLIFLVGGGLLAGLQLFLKRRFWRTE